MGVRVKTSDSVTIWDFNKVERLCKDLFLVPMHGCEGMENCIIVFVTLMFEAYEL
jgi:hypothetical protein